MRQGRWTAVGVVLAVALALFAAGGFGLGYPSIPAGMLEAQGLVHHAADLQWLGWMALGVSIAALLLGGLMGDVLGVWLLAEGLVLTAGGLLAFAFGGEREAMIAATAAAAAGFGLAFVGSVPILVRWIDARARPTAHVIAAAALGLGSLALDRAAPWVEGAAGNGIDLNALDLWAGIGALATALIVLVALGGGRARADAATMTRHGMIGPAVLLLAALLAGGAAAALQSGATARATAGALSGADLAPLFVVGAMATVMAPLVIVPFGAWSGPRVGLAVLLPLLSLLAIGIPYAIDGVVAGRAGFVLSGVFLTACYGLIVAIATCLVPTARPALAAGGALAAFEIGRGLGPYVVGQVARQAGGPVVAGAATALAFSLLVALLLGSGARRAGTAA